MGKARSVGLVLLTAMLLTSCAKTYDGGGYSLSKDTLIAEQSATVTLSSANPTAKELEQAIYEIIEVKARRISSLPHVTPNASVQCKDPLRLKQGKTLPCKLRSDSAPELVLDDFTVIVVGVENTDYELQVSSPTYWRHLESLLG